MVKAAGKVRKWNRIFNLPKYGNSHNTITSTAGLFQDKPFCGRPSEVIEMAHMLSLSQTHTNTLTYKVTHTHAHGVGQYLHLNRGVKGESA